MNCPNSEGSAVWLLTLQLWLPDGWDWQWQAQTQTEKANQFATIATGSGTTSLKTSDKQAEVIQCFDFQPSTNMAGFRLNKSFKVWGGVLWCRSGLMLDPSGYRGYCALYKASHALSQHTNITWWKLKRKFRPNLWQHILCFILSYSQRNSARFSDFSGIIIKSDFWVQKNRGFLFVCLFFMLQRWYEPTRRCSPKGISVGSPPPASPCWLNYSQHRWRQTRLCKSPADLKREKTFPACVDSKDLWWKSWFYSSFHVWKTNKNYLHATRWNKKHFKRNDPI